MSVGRKTGVPRQDQTQNKHGYLQESTVSLNTEIHLIHQIPTVQGIEKTESLDCITTLDIQVRTFSSSIFFAISNHLNNRLNSQIHKLLILFVEGTLPHCLSFPRAPHR